MVTRDLSGCVRSPTRRPWACSWTSRRGLSHSSVSVLVPCSTSTPSGPASLSRCTQDSGSGPGEALCLCTRWNWAGSPCYRLILTIYVLILVSLSGLSMVSLWTFRKCPYLGVSAAFQENIFAKSVKLLKNCWRDGTCCFLQRSDPGQLRPGP